MKKILKREEMKKMIKDLQSKCVEKNDKGDVKIYGNILFDVNDNEPFVLGPDNQEHFSINKLNHMGVIFRSDGEFWTTRESIYEKVSDLNASPWYLQFFHNNKH